jgi:predicted glutamine amidotransferase
MGRLIGYVANRSDRLEGVLEDERPALGDAPDGDAEAWGLGFYQGGEILHRKRPSRGGTPVTWTEIAGGVRTDCAVIHLRQATVGDYRAENTHPFRMRQWLFAHHGTVHGFDALREPLLAPMPDFLKRGIRGTTDSEHVFAAFLSFLHDEGQLDAPEAEAKVVLASVRATVTLIDRLSSEVGAPEAELDLMISNGRSLFVVRRGKPIHHTRREHAGERGGTFRYVLAVASDGEPAPGYKTMAPGSALVIGRDLSVTEHPL